MEFDVSSVYPEHKIVIYGASYAGRPENNTMMYVSQKAGHLVKMIRNHIGCICFVPEETDIPEDTARNNAIIKCKNPVYEYACFAKAVSDEFHGLEKNRKYTRASGGYYVGENTCIGKNADIGLNAVIGHGVRIGDDAVIMEGAVIKNAVIGNGFVCGENAVIGNQAFVMAQDYRGNNVRIPSLGHVVIGDYVEVGACSDIAAGACGDTVLEDYVKLDSLVYVGHEARLYKNAVIAAGSIIGGFAEIHEHAYLGINASIRNRIKIGKKAVAGMGAVTVKSVVESDTVAGNPAKSLFRGALHK